MVQTHRNTRKANTAESTVIALQRYMLVTTPTVGVECKMQRGTNVPVVLRNVRQLAALRGTAQL